MAWIYKPDGSIQCTGGAGTSPEEAKAELVQLVGEQNVMEFFAVGLFVIQLCGIPTGRCHAAKVTDEGFNTLMTGIAGPNGWAPWPFENDPAESRIQNQHLLAERVGEPGVPFPMRAGPEVPFPMKFDLAGHGGAPSDDWAPAFPKPALLPEIVKKLTSVSTAPSNLRDLIGYKLHVERPGDKDEYIFYFGRVVIRVDADERIADISFR